MKRMFFFLGAFIFFIGAPFVQAKTPVPPREIIRHMLIHEGVPESDEGFIDKITDELLAMPDFVEKIGNPIAEPQKLVHLFLKSEIDWDLKHQDSVPVQELVSMAEITKQPLWEGELSPVAREQLARSAHEKVLEAFVKTPEVFNGQSARVLYLYLPHFPFGEKITQERWQALYRLKDQNELASTVLSEYLNFWETHFDTGAESLLWVLSSGAFVLNRVEVAPYESREFIQRVYQKVAHLKFEQKAKFINLIPHFEIEERIEARMGLRRADPGYTMEQLDPTNDLLARDWQDVLLKHLKSLEEEPDHVYLLTPQNMIWLMRVAPQQSRPYIKLYLLHRLFIYDLTYIFSSDFDPSITTLLQRILKMKDPETTQLLMDYAAKASLGNTKVLDVLPTIASFAELHSPAQAREEFYDLHTDSALKIYFRSLLDSDIYLSEVLEEEPALVSALLRVGIKNLYPDTKTFNLVVESLLRAQGEFYEEANLVNTYEHFRLMKLFEEALRWGASFQTQVTASTLAQGILAHIELYRDLVLKNYDAPVKGVSGKRREEKAKVIDQQFKKFTTWLEASEFRFYSSDRDRLSNEIDEVMLINSATLSKEWVCNASLHGFSLQ